MSDHEAPQPPLVQITTTPTVDSTELQALMGEMRAAAEETKRNAQMSAYYLTSCRSNLERVAEIVAMAEQFLDSLGRQYHAHVELPPAPEPPTLSPGHQLDGEESPGAMQQPQSEVPGSSAAAPVRGRAAHVGLQPGSSTRAGLAAAGSPAAVAVVGQQPGRSRSRSRSSSLAVVGRQWDSPLLRHRPC